MTVNLFASMASIVILAGGRFILSYQAGRYFEPASCKTGRVANWVVHIGIVHVHVVLIAQSVYSVHTYFIASFSCPPPPPPPSVCQVEGRVSPPPPWAPAWTGWTLPSHTCTTSSPVGPCTPTSMHLCMYTCTFTFTIGSHKSDSEMRNDPGHYRSLLGDVYWARLSCP